MWGKIRAMILDLEHPWQVSPAEAVAIQEQLRSKVVCEDDFAELRWLGGVDVGFEAGGNIARAAVVVLSYPALELLEVATARLEVTFPYVPGLLSFREVPAILKALETLRQPPDMLLCDGQGIAHPRRFGLASHLGVLSGCPTIGVAKRRLVGEHAPLDEARGAWQPLYDQGEVVGAVLRTRAKARPLYISIGHRVSLETAIRLVLECSGRYRLPEPTRRAHLVASARMA